MSIDASIVVGDVAPFFSALAFLFTIERLAEVTDPSTSITYLRRRG
jgi:hypothetical protein